MTTKRVWEAIDFNVELKVESTWLWVKSEQMVFLSRQAGGGEHKERAEDLDKSQSAHGQSVAH